MAGYFSAASFRTLGTAATPHNLLTIENLDATKTVTIRRLTVQLDATAVLVAVMPQVKCSRATAVPTGGTALSKAQFDTAARSNWLVAPLCFPHHRGEGGFHGMGQRAFERTYKTTEAELLALTIEALHG